MEAGEIERLQAIVNDLEEELAGKAAEAEDKESVRVRVEEEAGTALADTQKLVDSHQQKIVELTQELGVLGVEKEALAEKYQEVGVYYID